MNISQYLSTALLNHSLGVATYTHPTTIWAAAYNVAPTNVGGGIEITASDYARVSTNWALASGGVIQNSLSIRFPTTGQTLSNWGDAVALGLFDSPTTGNLLWFGDLSARVTLSLGTYYLIAAQGLTIQLS